MSVLREDGKVLTLKLLGRMLSYGGGNEWIREGAKKGVVKRRRQQTENQNGT